MRRSTLASIFDISASQGGLVATWQAIRAGVSESALRRAVASGVLERAAHGVYRVAGAPALPHGDIAAAVLAAGPGAAATRGSALRLLGPLPQLHLDRPQIVTVGTARAKIRGVESHVTRRLEPEDVATVDGIRTETFGRAVLSVIGDPRVHWVWVARVLDAGMREWEDQALEQVEAAIERAGARGHSGVAVLRELVEERRAAGPADMFAFQRKVMRSVDAAGLGGIDEYHVHVGGRDRWLDRAWPDETVYLEVKGNRDHSSVVDLNNDVDRENDLAAEGWLLVQARGRTAVPLVVDRLRMALDSRRSAMDDRRPPTDFPFRTVG